MVVVIYIVSVLSSKKGRTKCKLTRRHLVIRMAKQFYCVMVPFKKLELYVHMIDNLFLFGISLKMHLFWPNIILSWFWS